MQARGWALLFLLSFLFSIVPAIADTVEDVEEDDDAEGDDEGDDIESPPAVTTSVIFPKSTDKVFRAGSVVDVLTSFVLGGEDQTAYVFAMRGYFASPFDTTKPVQNFTSMWFNESVTSDREKAFWYRFGIAADLEPREYATVLELWFVDSTNNTRIEIVYNNTVVVTSAPVKFDLKTISSVLMFVALIGAIGYTAYALLIAKKKRRVSAPAAPAAKIAAAEDSDDDFAPKDIRRFRAQAKASASKSASKNSAKK